MSCDGLKTITSDQAPGITAHAPRKRTGVSCVQVQMLCEDDKSKFIKVPKDKSEAEGNKFTWEEARFVFVVVFSHAEVLLNIKEGAFNIGNGTGRVAARIRVADLKQGDSVKTLDLRKENEDVRFQ
jgi:hypothetical protein